MLRQYSVALLGMTLVVFSYPAIMSAAHGLTFYICIDAAGKKTYQDKKPTDAECKVEQMEVDPDANVVPSDDFPGANPSPPKRAASAGKSPTQTGGKSIDPTPGVVQEPDATTSVTTTTGSNAAAGQTGASGAIAPAAAPAAAATAAGF